MHMVASMRENLLYANHSRAQLIEY